MNCGTAMAAGGRAKAVTFWVVGGIASLLLGATLAEMPIALAVALVVTAAVVLLLVVWREPRWGLIGVLVLLYSYAGWVFGHRVGAPDLAVVVLPLFVFILGMRRLLTGERVHVPREAGVLLALGATWALSAAFATDPARSIVRIQDFVGWALLATLMISLLDTAPWFRRAVCGIAVAAGALAALTIFQAVTRSYGTDFLGFAKIEAGARGGAGRSSGPLQANNFAQILVVAGTLALYLALSARSTVARVSGFAAAAACVAAILFTASRGGFIALAAVFALLVALRPVSRRALVTVAAVAVVAGSMAVPNAYVERLASIAAVFGSGVESTGDGAVRGRASENLAAVYMFAEHPIVGVGVANFPVRYLEYSQEIGLDTRARERTPHSLYLEAFAETGIIGAAALFFLLWLAARGAWRARRVTAGRERLVAEGTFVAICGFLVSAVFLHGAYPRYLWIVVGLGLTAGRLAEQAAAALVAGPDRNNSSPQPSASRGR